MNNMSMIQRYKYLYIILGIALILLIPHIYYTEYSKARLSGGIWNIGSEELSVSEVKEISRVIEAKVVGDKILFKMTIYYNESVYKVIVDNWDTYTNLFSKDISKFINPSIKTTNLNIEHEDNTFSVSITFEVHGAISRYGYECAANFAWLLRPLDLDLIYSHFKGFNDRLVWSGELDGVYYEITILLPMQNSPYSEWAHPNGYSYVNIWWRC